MKKFLLIASLSVGFSVILAFAVKAVVTPLAQEMAPQILKHYEAVENVLNEPSRTEPVSVSAAEDLPAEIDFPDIMRMESVQDSRRFLMTPLKVTLRFESTIALQNVLRRDADFPLRMRETLTLFAAHGLLSDTPRLSDTLGLKVTGVETAIR